MMPAGRGVSDPVALLQLKRQIYLGGQDGGKVGAGTRDT